MVLTSSYPHVINSLNGPTAPKHTFLVFYSSIDPKTGTMWCPVRVRASGLADDPRIAET